MQVPPAAMSEQQDLLLAQWLAGGKPATTPAVVAINGAQGSGKSTLALRLRELLAAQHGRRAVVLSIDDIYLPRLERERLAQDIHPLLRTRGVPGTHDLELGLRLLGRLGDLGTTTHPAPRHSAEAVRMPKFIKAADDRAAESEWAVEQGPVDLILFEGWCVGTPAQDEAELRLPVNELEAREDADGTWRRYVNEQLAMVYPWLFSHIDRTIFLQAPDFDSIYRWRLEQEGKNALESAFATKVDKVGELTPPLGPLPSHRDSLRSQGEGKTSGLMGPEELRRFIQHYERLTRHALKVMPERADVVMRLGPGHEVLATHFR